VEETEEDCEDIDRVVLYDDVVGLLCRINSEANKVTPTLFMAKDKLT
jgi:hypothetical protein